MKKNLGSVISGVADVSSKGYTVTFKNGDICNSDQMERYSSSIVYICGKTEVGWPSFTGYGVFANQNENKCHLNF